MFEASQLHLLDFALKAEDFLHTLDTVLSLADDSTLKTEINGIYRDKDSLL